MAQWDENGSDFEAATLPRHIAIIMDGNGRWAHQQGLPRIEGHRKGAESVREVVRTCRRLGIEVLTLFAFSEQNWDRPAGEIEALMELLYRYVLEERSEIMDNRIRLRAIGDIERLPPFAKEALAQLVSLSGRGEAMTLCLALSYGGREDITEAARRVATEVSEGRLTPAEIDASRLESCLWTGDLPPVDLLIRTSGELRISNFMLWQLAYAELLFTPTMWPEFREAHLLKALATYRDRERRFGLTSEQVHPDDSPGHRQP